MGLDRSGHDLCEAQPGQAKTWCIAPFWHGWGTAVVNGQDFMYNMRYHDNPPPLIPATPILQTGFLQELIFSDDPQGAGDVDHAGAQSGSVSAQGLAMVGVNRKMTRDAAVYTVHIGLEHSHVSENGLLLWVLRYAGW